MKYNEDIRKMEEYVKDLEPKLMQILISDTTRTKNEESLFSVLLYVSYRFNKHIDIDCFCRTHNLSEKEFNKVAKSLRNRFERVINAHKIKYTKYST